MLLGLNSMIKYSTMTVVIVGAGLSGCVLAEQCAAAGKHVIIVEKRDHIAGNCYDYINEKGILMSKYGPHFFHTSSERVWSYVQRFAEWVPYKARVVGTYKGVSFPVPVNITTVNRLLGQDIKTEEEMRSFMKTQQRLVEPINSEEVALSRVGPDLYEMIFRGYTKKQWSCEPALLDPSVLARIPVRYTFEDGYFSDVYQALPKRGYTEFCKSIIANPLIEVRLSTDYRAADFPDAEQVFYTGPIDLYFKDRGYPALEYRSLRFDIEECDEDFYQENVVVNYTDELVPWTRICEYKHILNQQARGTTIVKEFPSTVGEPYYPIPNRRNTDLYETYRKMALEEEKKGVYFVGRLANYKYFNMDQAIENALDVFQNVLF